jgi:hypothetical protein
MVHMTNAADTKRIRIIEILENGEAGPEEIIEVAAEYAGKGAAFSAAVEWVVNDPESFELDQGRPYGWSAEWV